MPSQKALDQSIVPSFDQCVANSLAQAAKAMRNPFVWNTGYYWYEAMNADCASMVHELSEVKLFTHKQTIDCTAIVSPGIPWESNKRDARSVLLAQAKETDLVNRQAICVERGVQTPYGWANHTKAWKVLDGLITFDKTPTSLKTWNFGQCAENPSRFYGVCVDQHMVHIICDDGQQGSLRITAKQYAFFEAVVIRAAEILGLLPSRLQAIMWQQRQYEFSYIVDSE